jgi:amidase
MWDALQGRQPRLPAARVADAGGGGRIGVCRTPYWDAADESQRSLFLEVVEVLRRRGVKPVEVVLPREFGALNVCHSDLMAYEASRNFVAEYGEDCRDLLGKLTIQSLREGWQVSTDRYFETRRLAARAKGNFRDLMDGFAALMVPAVPGEAPGLATTGDSLFCKAWSLLGVPTIALPVTRGPGGLPLAVQLVGAANDDESLMTLASAVQAILLSEYGPMAVAG